MELEACLLGLVAATKGDSGLALREALSLGPGSVVPLNADLDDLVVVKVDGKVVARGEVMVVDNNYAIRIVHVARKGETWSRMAPIPTAPTGTGHRQES